MRPAIAIALAGALAAGPALAEQQERAGFQIGTLTCKATEITNAIVFTETKFACLFEGTNGLTEEYVGEIDKVGIDLSIKNDVTIVWAVVAPTDTTHQAHQLEGTYVGAAADAALGLGAGARVLVGGGDEGFALQPISVDGIEGVGVSLGIESFELEPVA